MASYAALAEEGSRERIPKVCCADEAHFRGRCRADADVAGPVGAAGRPYDPRSGPYGAVSDETSKQSAVWPRKRAPIPAKAVSGDGSGLITMYQAGNGTSGTSFMTCLEPAGGLEARRQ